MAESRHRENIEIGPGEEDKEGHWLRVLGEGFVEATTEAAKDPIVNGVSLFLPAAIAGPVGVFVVSAVKSLFMTLDRRSEEIAKTIKTLLDEPFHTAARTLHDVASADIASPAESDEAVRQLRLAYDNFAKALTFAQSNDSARCDLILVYQGLIEAIIPGGRPFAENILTELRSNVGERRLRADRLRGAAASIDLEEPLKMMLLNRRFPGPPSMRMEAFAQQMGDAVELGHLESQKMSLESAATRLTDQCLQIEQACDLIGQLLAAQKKQLAP